MRVAKLGGIIAAVVMASGCWHWSGGGSGTPTTGQIQATLMQHVGGASSIPCQSHPVAFTFTSSAGATQQKTSLDAQADTKCEDLTIEGTTNTLCYCPATVASDAMAPGTWTTTALGLSCPCKVTAGATQNVTLYDDGRPCLCAL